MELLSLLLHLGYDLQLHAAALTAAPDRVLKKKKTPGVVRNGVRAAFS